MPTQQEKIIKKAGVEDKILQILYFAEVNLECSRVVLDYLSKYKSNPLGHTILLNLPKGKYLILCGNNHFFEAVELISGLLYPFNEKEISFDLWEKIGNLKISNVIQNVKDNFKSQKFLELRQNFIAHKNIKKAGDPDVITVLPIRKQLIDELTKIIQELQQEALNIFEDPTSNNYLLENSDGLKIFLEEAQQKLDKEVAAKINRFKI